LDLGVSTRASHLAGISGVHHHAQVSDFLSSCLLPFKKSSEIKKSRREKQAGCGGAHLQFQLLGKLG
jgi:hypothetical protein